MNRRHFVTMVALASSQAVVKTAAAQATVDRNALLRLVSEPSEREQLLQQTDLITALLAVSENRRRRSAPPPDARTPYFRVRASIANSNSREETIRALSSGEATARLESTITRLKPSLERLPGQLVEAGLTGSPLVNQLVQSFDKFCQLVSANPAAPAGWWCGCYGLRLLC